MSARHCCSKVEAQLDDRSCHSASTRIPARASLAENCAFVRAAFFCAVRSVHGEGGAPLKTGSRSGCGTAAVQPAHQSQFDPGEMTGSAGLRPRHDSGCRIRLTPDATGKVPGRRRALRWGRSEGPFADCRIGREPRRIGRLRSVIRLTPDATGEVPGRRPALRFSCSLGSVFSAWPGHGRVTSPCRR